MKSCMKHGYKIYSKKNLWITLEVFNHINKWQGAITTLLKIWMSCQKSGTAISLFILKQSITKYLENLI